MKRREFVHLCSLASAALALGACSSAAARKPWFNISLAQWSLHRMLHSGALVNLDFPAYTRTTFDIGGVEYVNSFFIDKAKDAAYLAELNNRAKDNGVENVLIMIDREGPTGAADETVRQQTVENHKKWIDAAHTLGCHAIRVNAKGDKDDPIGSAAQTAKSLKELCDYAAGSEVSVLVENHGGLSSNAAWLASVMESVAMDNCGTLPDFGNFTINRDPKEVYDKYQGVEELMPYAKAVSAKCYHFENGQETTIDFSRMLSIVKDAGYTGYVGIEFEGKEMTEKQGVLAAKELLESLRYA